MRKTPSKVLGSEQFLPDQRGTGRRSSGYGPRLPSCTGRVTGRPVVRLTYRGGPNASREGGPGMRTARSAKWLLALLPLVTVFLVIRGQAATDGPLLVAARNGDLAGVRA